MRQLLADQRHREKNCLPRWTFRAKQPRTIKNLWVFGRVWIEAPDAEYPHPDPVSTVALRKWQAGPEAG